MVIRWSGAADADHERDDGRNRGGEDRLPHRLLEVLRRESGGGDLQEPQSGKDGDQRDHGEHHQHLPPVQSGDDRAAPGPTQKTPTANG